MNFESYSHKLQSENEDDCIGVRRWLRKTKSGGQSVEGEVRETPNEAEKMAFRDRDIFEYEDVADDLNNEMEDMDPRD